MQIIRLDPGELFISTSPSEVHTVLGSCVSVTFFHPRLKQGAICHGRKPTQGCIHGVSGLKLCQDLGDYVSCSLEFMLAYFDHRGVSRSELEIKLFGGGMMFNTLSGNAENPVLNTGKRNIDMAMEFFRAKRLHLMSSDIGGPWARQIVFYSETGEIKMKRIRKTAQDINNLVLT
ncbi:MAG: chemotaxis protein CheD [Magnetococcales bacterium]|nr:chemotaxis protein CheD [Magnetococcales bacterium]MBF0438240.1 chemotaxis protein CheD [Magnetococcales bacterium]